METLAPEFRPFGGIFFGENMDKQNYPTTIALYSEGKISRAEFLAAFAEWQKANGVDYDCKGGSRWNGLCVTYRGRLGTIRKGHVEWSGLKAASIFNFCRAVDIALCGERRMVAFAKGGRK